MQRAKMRELLAIAVFIAASTVALRNFDIFPPLTDEAREAMGTPPSREMLGFALIVYSFSVIIRILARMMEGSLKTGGLGHAGYLCAFYLFYYLSDLLEQNFWAVFASGVTIFALESYQLWSHREDGDNEP